MRPSFLPKGDGHLRALFTLLNEAELNRARADRADGQTALNYVRLGVHLRDAARRDAFLIGPNALEGLRASVTGETLSLRVQLGTPAQLWLGMHPITASEGEYPYCIFEDQLAANLPIVVAKTLLGKVFGTDVYFGPKTCQQCLAAALHRNESGRIRSDMRRSGDH